MEITAMPFGTSMFDMQSGWSIARERTQSSPEESGVADTAPAARSQVRSTYSAYTAMTDVHLLRCIALRDKEALEALYDRYVRVCYGLALKIVSDPFVAEEITQDVFMKLWTNPAAYAPDRGKFLSWLLMLVRNRAIDEIRWARSRTRANYVPLKTEDGIDTNLAEGLPNTAAGPHEVAWQREQGNAIRSALSLLSAPHRQVITLAYFGGLTQKEIADRTGLPLGTVKTRTCSALRRLHDLLAGQGLLGE